MECINKCYHITLSTGSLWCEYYERSLEMDWDENGEYFTAFRCAECEYNTKDSEYKSVSKESAKELLKQVDAISETFVDFQDKFSKSIRDLYYLVREI